MCWHSLDEVVPQAREVPTLSSSKGQLNEALNQAFFLAGASYDDALYHEN